MTFNVVIFELSLASVQRQSSMYGEAERFLVVGLFGNIRSMTPLLVVSASQEFQPVERKIWPTISIHSFLLVQRV